MSLSSRGEKTPAAGFNPMAMLHEVNIPLETPFIRLRRVCVNLFLSFTTTVAAAAAAEALMAL